MLLPFVKGIYPDEHRLIAGNDSDHTSRAAAHFQESIDIYWCCTPAESPNLNAFENLWHELKEYVKKSLSQRKEIELKKEKEKR